MPTSSSLLLGISPMSLLILGMSIIAITLFIERLLFLHKGQIRALSFILGIKNLLKKNRLLEALTVCEETPGPVAQVVKTALLHHDRPELVMRGEVERTALLQLPVLERRLGSLLMIAQVAPLLGLMGTILAFLNGFLKMQEEGPYAQISLFSSDIVQALICLILGLLLSTLVYIGYYFLKARTRSIAYDIEWAGTAILQFLLLHPDSQDEAMLQDSGNTSPKLHG